VEGGMHNGIWQQDGNPLCPAWLSRVRYPGEELDKYFRTDSGNSKKFKEIHKE
jgi:hypothetical protein